MKSITGHGDRTCVMSLFALLSLTLLVSCSKQELETGDKSIRFTASASTEIAWLSTKGAQKAAWAENDEVSLYAWKSSGTTFSGATKYFETSLTYNGSSWTYSPAQSYPGDNLFFRAVYPVPSSSNGITMSDDRKTITYSTPSTLADQPDLMVASVDCKTSGTVDLPFSHALASVKFVVGSTMTADFKLTQVKISGIVTVGSFDYSTWTPSATTGDFTYGDGTNAFYTQVAQAAGTNMLPDDNCFMVVPQSFASTSTAKITIKYLKPNGTASEASLDLKSTSFEKGKSYVYNVSFKEDGGFANVTVNYFTDKAW